MSDSTPAGHSGRRRPSGLLIGVLAVAIIAIVLIVILVIALLKPGPSGPPPIPGASSSAAPSSSTAETPDAQPADCPDVQVISVPGTLESSPNDDPYNPRFNRRSLMLGVSNPLNQKFDDARADVWTTPYLAQFSNPVAIPPDGQATYQVSRAQGDARTRAKITQVYDKCKLTNFVLMGFSQGAVIAGDIAADIGNGKGPIPAANVLGVGLISDGRRVVADANDVGETALQGEGVEAVLGGFSVPGLNLRGPRPGGFGELKSKTQSICGNNDPICNLPTDTFNPNSLLTSLPQIGRVLATNSHALYATTKDWAFQGLTAQRWLTRWAEGVITDAPKPKHN